MANGALASFDSLIYYRGYTLTEPPPAGTFIGKAHINISMISDTQNITLNLYHKSIRISERFIEVDLSLQTAFVTTGDIKLTAREVNIVNITNDVTHEMVTLHLSSMMYVGERGLLDIDFV